MPQSIPKGQSRESLLRATADIDAGLITLFDRAIRNRSPGYGVGVNRRWSSISGPSSP